MTTHDAPTPEQARLPEPHVEYAVEVTWRDWRKAGAKGPTSVFGPMLNVGHRDRFIAMQDTDREVTATRGLTRLAAYTEWEHTPEPDAVVQ